MDNFDISAFDFATMTNGVDPFEAKKTFEKDERFYTLPKNEQGAGSAIIAFLPDMNKNMFKRMEKINATVIDENTKKRRFVSTYSPRTIQQKCPFAETSYRLYQEGDKESAKIFRPQTKFISNIYIVKDPAQPENEGKVFLYEMSKTMHQKLQEALEPDENAVALGETRKEIYNPLRGWVFKLTCKKGDNGITNYDSSSFTQLPQGKCIFGDTATPDTVRASGTKAMDVIKNKCYDLNEFHKPETFKSYDELYSELQRIAGGKYGIHASASSAPQVQINDNSSNVVVNEVVATAPQAPASEPAQTVNVPNPDTTANDIDNLIAGLDVNM